MAGRSTRLLRGLRSETRALIGAFTVYPSRDDILRTGTMVDRMVNSGLWSKTDYLVNGAAHDAQAARVNWKNPGVLTASEVANPVFTLYRGYAGNGTSSYQQTGWAPNAGVLFTQNDASISFWCNSSSSDNKGLVGSTDETLQFLPRYSNGNTVSRLNSTTALQTANTTPIGFFTANRTSITAVEHFQNATSKGTGIATSALRSSIPVTIGAISVNPTWQFSVDQVALLMVGASRTAVEEAQLYDIIREYMRGVGNA